MSEEFDAPHGDDTAAQRQRVGFPFDNLTPWLYVAMWYLIRPLTVEAGAIDPPLTGGLVHPLVWELIWLATVTGLVGTAKFLAWIIKIPLIRLAIAFATYVTVPYAVVFFKTLVAPPPPSASYYSQFPESLILSVGIGIIAVVWASPLSRLKTLELGLDSANKELVGLQNSVLEKKQSAQHNLDAQVQSVVAPEIEKVVNLLTQGSLTQARSMELSSQIHTSISGVLRPFAQKLITDTSITSHEPHTTRPSELRRLSFFEPISVRNAVHPLLLGSIPAAWLSIVWARDLSLTWPESGYLLVFTGVLVSLVVALGWAIKALIPRVLRVNPLLAFFLLLGSIPAAWLSIVWARDLSLTWPESGYLLVFTGVLVSLVVALGWAIKALIPRVLRVNPLLAFFSVAGISAGLTYLPIAVITTIPRDFLAYQTWGFLTTFPAAAPTIAIICPAMAIGGILIARHIDVIGSKEQTQRAIVEHNAALNTELWHLQRQAALMVHGPIQSALISVRLRLESTSPRAEESENLVRLLEGTLSNLVTTQRAESLPEFLESLEDLWEGVGTLRAHTGEPVLRVLEKSPASLHACSQVIREGVNNAIFHGNATDIDITVTMLNRNTVHVRVEDNGSGPSPRRTPGVGSDLLNTVSSGWNLLRIGDTTVLTVNLFIPSASEAGESGLGFLGLAHHSTRNIPPNQ